MNNTAHAIFLNVGSVPRTDRLGNGPYIFQIDRIFINNRTVPIFID